MNAVCKRYLRQVRSWLPGTHKTKQTIVASLREDMLQYLQENSDPTEEMLHQRFGAPQQIAAAYVDEMGTPELLENLRIRRRVLTIIVSLVLAVIMIWLAAVGIALWDSHENAMGSVDDGVIEVIQ